MGKRRVAPLQMTNQPVLRELTYGSLDWVTHPIDLYDGPQGWGPFNGPWTPIDFADPAADISYMYGSGESNDWEFAPPYDVISVFADHSLDFAWNTSYDVAAERAAKERAQEYNSTIANVSAPPTMLSRLRYVLQGGQ